MKKIIFSLTILLFLSSCLPLRKQISTSTETPLYVMDSLDNAAKYAHYTQTGSILSIGTLYKCSIIPSMAFPGDTFHVCFSDFGENLESVIFYLDGAKQPAITSFSDSIKLNFALDSIGKHIVALKTVYHGMDDGSVPVPLTIKASWCLVPYAWKVNFSYYNLPLTADEAVIQFDIDNMINDSLLFPSMDSLVVCRQENSIVVPTKQIPAIIKDTISLMDNGQFHYDVYGYLWGVPCDSASFEFSVHSGEIVFMGEAYQEVKGSFNPTTYGLIPDIFSSDN